MKNWIAKTLHVYCFGFMFTGCGTTQELAESGTTTAEQTLTTPDRSWTGWYKLYFRATYSTRALTNFPGTFTVKDFNNEYAGYLDISYDQKANVVLSCTQQANKALNCRADMPNWAGQHIHLRAIMRLVRDDGGCLNGYMETRPVTSEGEGLSIFDVTELPKQVSSPDACVHIN